VTQIAIVVGSLRENSFNRRLAKALVKLAPEGITFAWPDIGGLPLYDQDDDDQQAEPVKALKAAILAADAVIFVTPEYNRSVPGVLKNAIDHGSRPWGQSSWPGKPAGVIGASVGAAGTAMAQQHLRAMLAHMDMPTLGQPETFLQVRPGTFDDAGNLVSDDTRRFLQRWIDAYAAWVRRLLPR